jgi:hypothetical protein
LTRSLKAQEVNWLPWSLCTIEPLLGLRLLIAIPSALITNDAACWLSIDQPTTLREYASRTTQQ